MDALINLKFDEKRELTKKCELCIACGGATYEPFKGLLPCGAMGQYDDICRFYGTTEEEFKELMLEKEWGRLTDFEKIYWLLEDLKKYCLMAEHFNIQHKQFFPKNSENLIEQIENNIKAIKGQLGEKAFKITDDYFLYTSDIRPDLYLDQIENPDIVDSFFFQFEKLVEEKHPKGDYVIYFDYLFPRTLRFQNAQEAQLFRWNNMNMGLITEKGGEN